MRKIDNKKKYLVLLSIILVVGCFIILAVNRGDIDDFFKHKLRSASWQNIVFIIFIIALPISLLLFGVALLKKRSYTKDSSDKQGVNEGEDASMSDIEEKESRFFMLTQTDEEMQKKKKEKEKIKYNDTITLKELCERFRNFAASQARLYYEASDIRQFISGLAVSHILVMQGMSGTGKTSLAYAFGEFINNKSTIVPIQPMWKERTDLIGYYNEFTKKFNETVLLQKMYEANYSEELYITVLDEMNIARVEYYFAEFLSLLELPNPNSRYLDVVTDVKEKDPKKLENGKLKLPQNMWFIGTANNDDSTFAISDKVYDRAMIMNLDKKSKWFDAPYTEGIRLTESHWESLIERAMAEYELTTRNKKRIGKLDEYMIEHFHITFGNRIMKQINCYVPVMIACGGTELEAIDDILSKKVLRKLESQNPIYVRNSAEGLKSYLDELFGRDKMEKCKAYLTQLERNA